MSTKTRLWILGTAVVCAALILFGIVGGLMPQLTQASNTNSLAEDADHLNEVQRAQLAQLEQAKNDRTQLESELDELRKAIPETAASADWIAELHAIERSSGGLVSDFKVQIPLNEESGDSASAPAAEDTEAAAEGTETAVAGSTAQPAQASGVEPLPIFLEVIGEERADLAAFMRDVEAGERLFVVQTTRIWNEKSPEETPWKLTIVGSLYYAAP